MGNISSILSQAYPPKPTWHVDNIPDLSNMVAVVTGGNSGCGKETVKALLEHNATVYLAARSEERARNAIQKLKSETGHEAIYLQLDLADLKSVRRCAEEFLSKEKELHILFNNAGVMACPIELTTEQGYDMQFGCNVIGHYQFTQLLLPSLLAASESTGRKSRVVTTSSSACYMTNNIDFAVLVDGEARRRCSPNGLYIASKFANVVVSREVARRYGDSIVSTSVNPGNIRTSLYRHVPKALYLFHYLFFNHQPEPLGAVTQLYAGTARETEDSNGKFFIPWAREGAPNAATQDPDLGKRLWEWLEGECGQY